MNISELIPGKIMRFEMGMKKKEFEEYFPKYRNALNEEIITLKEYVLIYEEICNGISSELQDDKFWKKTKEAYYNSIVIWLYKLLDANGRKGIIPFLRFIKSHLIFLLDDNFIEVSRVNFEKIKLLSQQKLNKDIKTINDLRIFQSVQKQRDKYYAHFDSKYFFEKEKLEIEAPILIAEIKASLSVIDSVFDIYLDRTDFKIKNYFDIKGIMKY